MKLRIREARKRAGFTQGQVAEKIGISQPYFAQIERGERKLDTRLQYKIANALGVDPHSLIDFDAPEETDEEFLLNVFRSYSPEQRDMWLSMARSISGASKPKPDSDRD